MMIGVHHLQVYCSTFVTESQYKNSAKVLRKNVYFFVRFAILLPVTENLLKPHRRQDVRKKMDNCKNSNQNNNQNQNNQNNQNKNQNNNQNKNQNNQNNNY